MAKNDKKSPESNTPETPVEATSAPAESTAVTVVDSAPKSAMTPAALTAASTAANTLEQYEAGLARLETHILDLGSKYPEWEEALMDVLQRYGRSSGGDAFDVSVNAPMTYFRLRHGMSKNVPKDLKVNVGEFFTEDTNLGEKFDALMVYAHDSRKLFPDGAELGAPECQSHDGKFGSRYGDCSTCPFAKFDDAKNKTPCSKGYAIILATPDFKIVGELSFLKTKSQAGRQLLQRMIMMKGGHSRWVTEIGTTEVTVGKHTNAVPTGGLPKTPTTDEQREVLEALTKFFKLRAMVFAARAEKRRVSRGLSDGGSAGAAGGALGAGSEEEVPLL